MLKDGLHKLWFKELCCLVFFVGGPKRYHTHTILVKPMPHSLWLFIKSQQFTTVAAFDPRLKVVRALLSELVVRALTAFSASEHRVRRAVQQVLEGLWRRCTFLNPRRNR